MNKKGLLITLVIFAVVLGAAAILYPKLSANMQPGQIATTPPAAAEASQPAETMQSAAETTETTEPTEPEAIKAPNFTAVDWEGNEVQFSDYVGKPIVLNFWAYWCGPCQMEMPEFNASYEQLGGEVTFLMVHADANTESGKQIVTDAGYTFPVVFDEAGLAGMTYGITAYPTTFFVDAAGNLQAYYMGAMNADLLQQGIDRIYNAE